MDLMPNPAQHAKNSGSCWAISRRPSCRKSASLVGGATKPTYYAGTFDIPQRPRRYGLRLPAAAQGRRQAGAGGALPSRARRQVFAGQRRRHQSAREWLRAWAGWSKPVSSCWRSTPTASASASIRDPAARAESGASTELSLFKQFVVAGPDALGHDGA